MHPIEEKLRKLLPVDTEGTDSLWRYFLSGEGKEREQTDELIDILLDKEINKDFRKKILLEPPERELCYGEYELGSVVYPETHYAIFGVREGEWLKHVLITGMTGSGKTNSMFQILKEFAKKGKPFWIFDWKKNYRDMLQFPEFKDNLIVLTPGKSVSPFLFNPLIPPDGVEPTLWLLRLVDVIQHAYFSGLGVEYFLRESIHHYYGKFGVYEGEKTYPTFFQIYDYIRKKKVKGRMALWYASTVRVLASLTFPFSMGSVVNTDNNDFLKELLNKNVVIELDGLADADKIFLTEALILWLYEFRKNEGKREHFKHAILLEECHNILSEKKENREGVETIMETCLRQIREFGEAVVAIDQEPSKVSNSLKANSFTKICFALGNGKDIDNMANAMMLSDDERPSLDLLDTGAAIIKLKGRFHQPVFVKFPLVAINKGLLTDDKVKDIMKQHIGYPPKGVKK